MRKLDADRGGEVRSSGVGRREIGVQIHDVAMFAHGKLLGKPKVCCPQLASGVQVWHHANMRLKLKDLRTSRKWTIDRLADETGLSRGFISQLENGKREPSAETLRSLSETFGVPIPELIDAGDEADDVARVVAAMALMSETDRQAMARHAEALAKFAHEER